MLTDKNEPEDDGDDESVTAGESDDENEMEDGAEDEYEMKDKVEVEVEVEDEAEDEAEDDDFPLPKRRIARFRHSEPTFVQCATASCQLCAKIFVNFRQRHAAFTNGGAITTRSQTTCACAQHDWIVTEAVIVSVSAMVRNYE